MALSHRIVGFPGLDSRRKFGHCLLVSRVWTSTNSAAMVVSMWLHWRFPTVNTCEIRLVWSVVSGMIDSQWNPVGNLWLPQSTRVSGQKPGGVKLMILMRVSDQKIGVQWVAKVVWNQPKEDVWSPQMWMTWYHGVNIEDHRRTSWKSNGFPSKCGWLLVARCFPHRDVLPLGVYWPADDPQNTSGFWIQMTRTWWRTAVESRRWDHPRGKMRLVWEKWLATLV